MDAKLYMQNLYWYWSLRDLKLYNINVHASDHPLTIDVEEINDRIKQRIKGDL